MRHRLVEMERNVGRGRHFEAYVTAIVSVALAALTFFGDLVSTDLRWAACMAGIGLLVYRSAAEDGDDRPCAACRHHRPDHADGHHRPCGPTGDSRGPTGEPYGPTGDSCGLAGEPYGAPGGRGADGDRRLSDAAGRPIARRDAEVHAPGQHRPCPCGTRPEPVIVIAPRQDARPEETGAAPVVIVLAGSARRCPRAVAGAIRSARRCRAEDRTGRP
jgi:hypothetical protein